MDEHEDGYYDEHGFYHQIDRDEAAGLGCLAIIVIMLLFATGALVSAIDALGHLWT